MELRIFSVTLCVLAAIHFTNAKVIVNCDLATDEMSRYRIWIHGAEVNRTGDSNVFTGFTCPHLPGKDNNDVEVFMIRFDYTSEKIFEKIGNFFSKLTKFEWSWGNLKKVREEDFKSFPDLVHVDLSLNKIQKLDGDSFSKNKKIQTLYFYSNEISEIEKDTFEKLSELTMVSFDSNKIRSLDGKLFSKSKKISSIYFRNNEISEIGKGLLDELSELRIISFDSNKLRALDGKLFSKNKKIEEMYFFKNELTQLPSGLLDGLTELWHVRFENNKLRSLDDDLFRTNTKIRDLYLQNNEISVIGAGLLKGLTELKSVNFQDNKIRSLDGSFFSTNREIELIVFKSNQISEVGPGLLDGLDSLRSAFFQNNSCIDFEAYESSSRISELKELLQNNCAAKTTDIPTTIATTIRPDEFCPIGCNQHFDHWSNEINLLRSENRDQVEEIATLKVEVENLKSIMREILSLPCS